MFARNVSVHLKSNMLSDDIRTFAKDILPSLRKQNGMRKLIVGGMLLGLLTGVCFAQRAAPSARPAPNANTVAPNASPVPSASPAIPSASPVTPSASTADPNANTVDPNVNTVAPGTNTVGPTDMTQKPPIPPNTVVSPDAAPPIPQH